MNTGNRVRRSNSVEGMDVAKWNTLVAQLPHAHVLQTWEWAQVKSKYGWLPHPTIWHDQDGQIAAAAMVLERIVDVINPILRLRVMYVPKGPLLRDWGDAALRQQVYHDLYSLARGRGNIFVKIDPDVCLGEGETGHSQAKELPQGQAVVTSLKKEGWRFSPEQIQFRNTVMIDLRPSEEEILRRMKQKTRYNVRLAERRGVAVRVGTQADLEKLYQMYAETSVRDGFVIREQVYYLSLWDTFMSVNKAEPLIAEVGDEPVAAVFIFRFAGKAWYLFGMSRPVHREKMPNHLLQWEAIKRSKAAGCDFYDMWGAPDDFEEHDSLWGVYRFKEGFGGKVLRHIGAWDLPVRRVSYLLYTQVLPRVLAQMRRRGLARTEESI
jgi:peptidoglycan pentaglycine glycine transferase (the first glycine)